MSQAFPGEIRARHEPELAFRIGGKVIRRLVEVGERVKDQPLAELDPQDVRLQLEAARAQVSAAEANLQTVRAEYRRYRTCSTATWSAIPSSRTSRTATAPARRG